MSVKSFGVQKKHSTKLFGVKESQERRENFLKDFSSNFKHNLTLNSIQTTFFNFSDCCRNPMKSRFSNYFFIQSLKKITQRFSLNLKAIEFEQSQELKIKKLEREIIIISIYLKGLKTPFIISIAFSGLKLKDSFDSSLLLFFINPCLLS